MTEEQEKIVEEAKIKYPQGTIHYGQEGKKKGKTYTIIGEFYWRFNHLFCNGDNGCIYNSFYKTWSEIIFTPE